MPTVDILGKVTQRPRYDVQSAKLLRGALQAHSHSQPQKAERAAVVQPLLMNYSLKSKFTAEFTAMYSDNGLRAASIRKQREEQLLKKKMLFEKQKAEQKEPAVQVPIVYEEEEVDDLGAAGSRFERLHKERQELYEKMNNAALRIQLAFRGHYARQVRLKVSA